MTLIIRPKIYLLFILLSLLSLNSQAQRFAYEAKVKGMVCAFCAYSVSKNISQLPGVDANSIDINLKSGDLSFISSKKVSEQKLSDIFKTSGFSISNLQLNPSISEPINTSDTIELDLKIDILKVDLYSHVIQSIGQLAANSSSRIIIKAPATQEQSILKPLLMGRQQVLKVKFIATESDIIHLQLLD